MQSRRLSPTETLTFLFTDIEGSTTTLLRLGDTSYADLLARHHDLVRATLHGHQGEEVDTQGDAFFAVFSSPRSCLAGALHLQRAISTDPLLSGAQVKVRMGVHSGEAERTPAGIVGLDVHRAARIAGVAHGGQVLVSESAAALVRASLADGVSLRDLGSHRLKDLGQPEHIYQLVAGGLREDFPPLRSLDNPALPNNLPAQLGTFVGRRVELPEIRQLLGSSRLVTLTGAGGCGKTRLALQVAAELLDGSGDGVFLVELAAVVEESAVPDAVRDALRIAPQPGRSAYDTLLGALGPQRLLVVLDNCEHLVDACAKLADAVLRRCPDVVLLATSREPLGISGESIYRVPSLSVSNGSSGPELGDAATLFCERARAQGAALDLRSEARALVTSICRRLDGMPLAIELAAARTRSMSLASIHQRLDHRFRLLTGGSRSALERQQTLRATVDWSYSLLRVPEQAVLRRLSVFADGFDLPAAEAVCGHGDVDVFDVADLVGSLVDKSLVVIDQATTEERYRLLETIRQYAAERLLEEGDEAVHQLADLHAAHYLSVAEAAEPLLTGPDRRIWLQRLATEQENLRRAVEHVSGEEAGAESLYRFAKALARYWLFDWRMQEMKQFLLPRLDVMPAGVDPLLYGYALITAAGLDRFDVPAASDLVARGLDVARQTGDPRLLEFALSARAALSFFAGVPAEGLPFAEEAVRVARELADPVVLGDSMVGLISVKAYLEPDAVPGLLEEALSVVSRSGDKLTEFVLRNNAAVLALRMGDLDDAEHQLERADRLRIEVDSHLHYVCVNLGWVRRGRGRLEEARALFEEALRSSRHHGDELALGYGTLGLACVELDIGDAGRAAVLLGFAEGLFDRLGELTLEPEDGYRREAGLAVRAALGTETFAAAVAVGRAMGVQEIFEYATGGDGAARPAGSAERCTITDAVASPGCSWRSPPAGSGWSPRRSG